MQDEKATNKERAAIYARLRACKRASRARRQATSTGRPVPTLAPALTTIVEGPLDVVSHEGARLSPDDASPESLDQPKINARTFYAMVSAKAPYQDGMPDVPPPCAEHAVAARQDAQ